jgi:hypothetical protein
MIDAGYFVKHIERRPDWLPAPGVVEICSVSHCISAPPDGWIERWLHNGLGWFNRESDARSVVPAGQEAAYRLFAYRLHPTVFRKGAGTGVPFTIPGDVRPDPIPETFRSLGFDSVSSSMEEILGFECSPLSCNSMAEECPTNEHCLFPSLDAALAGAARFAREQPEPGDYYVVEVLEEVDSRTAPEEPRSR